MTWLAAFSTGTGAGLAYFGGLWLTLRLGTGRALVALSYLARFALVAVTFYALGRHGAFALLAGLAGMLVARHWILHTRGGNSDAR